MGNKALFRLLIVFVVVGAIALLFLMFRPGKIETVTSSTDREKVFANFPINDVSHIRIKGMDGELNLKKSAAGWVVSERDNYPADASAAIEVLRTVWDLKIVQSPQIGPSQYERLSLIDPAKGSGETGATIVSFLDAEGKELDALWLGKILERESGQPTPYGPTTTEAGRYVKTGDEDSVFLVSETFNQMETDPAEWLDDAFFGISKLKSIEIQSETPENDWKLVREEENGDFTLVDAEEGEELDNLKVSSMKNAFSSPRFEDVIVGEEAKEKAPGKTTFEIETFDGYAYTVKLGEKTDLNEYFLTFAVKADFPEKREPQEEETDEEAKQRNEEFASALEALKAKLAEQEKFAGKVYKVRSSVADSLVKTREEILKSEDPAAAAGGASFTPGAIPSGPPPANIPGLPEGIIPAHSGTEDAPEDSAPMKEDEGDKAAKKDDKAAPEKETGTKPATEGDKKEKALSPDKGEAKTEAPAAADDKTEPDGAAKEGTDPESEE